MTLTMKSYRLAKWCLLNKVNTNTSFALNVPSISYETFSIVFLNKIYASKFFEGLFFINFFERDWIAWRTIRTIFVCHLTFDVLRLKIPVWLKVGARLIGKKITIAEDFDVEYNTSCSPEHKIQKKKTLSYLECPDRAFHSDTIIQLLRDKFVQHLTKLVHQCLAM